MPAESRRWTTLAALRAQSLKSWDKGDLLRELLEPTDTYPRRRTLRRPSATELRDSYAAARAWAAEFHPEVPGFTLEFAAVGHTTIGSNRVPAAAVFGSALEEIQFLGRRREAERFMDLARKLEELRAELRAWAARRPLALLELGADSLTAARVALWIVEHPRPDIYLRQLSLPGVHTKFVENHRRTIDEMIATLRPDVAAAPAPSSTSLGPAPGSRFAVRHGFRTAPEPVRFRMLDPDVPLLGNATDLTVTATAFSTLDLPVRRVIMTENLVNFLALPEQPGTLALFGGGYGFSALAAAGWLQSCDVLYWGDLDTHGFRILDQLRAAHSHVHSVMMDAGTLLAHRLFWGREPKPSRAALTRLTFEEQAVYTALATDEYGPSIRLEQEHIQWEWARERLLPGGLN